MTGGGGGGVDVVPQAATADTAMKAMKRALHFCVRLGIARQIRDAASEIMTNSLKETSFETTQTSRSRQALEPGLYLVATPIGNLRDVTLRALDVLTAADLVLAEDTRVTRKLLDAYDIKASLQAYHDHNAETVRPQIEEALQAGKIIALVSDAGTPMVSDPGYKLARMAIDEGQTVVAIPGASAVLTALCVSGLPTDSFTFAGFPPSKTVAREKWLEKHKAVPGSLVIYEGASRIPASLASMAKVFGDRPAAVCRELTKFYEEARRGSLDELAAHYADAGSPKGEVVIVIGPAPDDIWDEARIDAGLLAALTDMRVKEASSHVAEQSGWAKRDVYARAIALKDGKS